MANVRYPKTRKAAYNGGGIDLLTDTIRVIGVKSGYTYDDAHEFLSDVPTAQRVGNAGGTARGDGTALTGKTISDAEARFDFDDPSVTIPDAVVVAAWVFYEDDGVADASSRLLAFIDTATNLPVTGVGGQAVPCSLTGTYAWAV